MIVVLLISALATGPNASALRRMLARVRPGESLNITLAPGATTLGRAGPLVLSAGTVTLTAAAGKSSSLDAEGHSRVMIVNGTGHLILINAALTRGVADSGGYRERAFSMSSRERRHRERAHRREHRKVRWRAGPAQSRPCDAAQISHRAMQCHIFDRCREGRCQGRRGIRRHKLHTHDGGWRHERLHRHVRGWRCVRRLSEH